MNEYVMTDRLHFNCGFHDAQADRRRGRQKRNVACHFNVPYAFGYLAGWANPESDSSANAWKFHVEHAVSLITISRDANGTTFAYRIAAPTLIKAAGGYEDRLLALRAAMADLLTLTALGLTA